MLVVWQLIILVLALPTSNAVAFWPLSFGALSPCPLHHWWYHQVTKSGVSFRSTSTTILSSTNHDDETDTLSSSSSSSATRRRILRQIITMATTLSGCRTTAVAMEKVTPLTTAQAEERLRAGRQSIQYLLDHYDEIIVQGGGDNVRRYLGTVGMTSGLVNINKAMKVLADQADDFMDYTETQNEVVQSIQQADGSAYMAIFVTTSPSETPPAKYFADAKVEVRNCIKALDYLAELIGMKY